MFVLGYRIMILLAEYPQRVKDESPACPYLIIILNRLQVLMVLRSCPTPIHIGFGNLFYHTYIVFNIQYQYEVVLILILNMLPSLHIKIRYEPCTRTMHLKIGPLSRTARPVAQAKSSITTLAKLRLFAPYKIYYLYNSSR